MISSKTLYWDKFIGRVSYMYSSRIYNLKVSRDIEMS